MGSDRGLLSRTTAGNRAQMPMKRIVLSNIEVYEPLTCNFRVWASDERVRIFSLASKLANLLKKCATFRARSKYAKYYSDVTPSSHHDS